LVGGQAERKLGVKVESHGLGDKKEKKKKWMGKGGVKNNWQRDGQNRQQKTQSDEMKNGQKVKRRRLIIIIKHNEIK